MKTFPQFTPPTQLTVQKLSQKAKNCSKVLLEFGKDFGARILSLICSKLPTAVISYHKF